MRLVRWAAGHSGHSHRVQKRLCFTGTCQWPRQPLEQDRDTRATRVAQEHRQGEDKTRVNTVLLFSSFWLWSEQTILDPKDGRISRIHGQSEPLLYSDLLSWVTPFVVTMQKHKKRKAKRFFLSAVVRIVDYTYSIYQIHRIHSLGSSFLGTQFPFLWLEKGNMRVRPNSRENFGGI